MAYTNFEDLVVWQKAMQLAEDVYRITASFPVEEKYALVNQLCRAATSVPSNIAEGNGRTNKSEYSYFLSVARGSVSEVETQLILASRIGFTTEDDIRPMLDICIELRKMLSKMINTLKD